MPAKGRGLKGPCTRTVKAGALSLKARLGTNTVRFAGRLRGTRTLRPGRYTVTFTATNAGGLRSRPASLRFTIVR